MLISAARWCRQRGLGRHLWRGLYGQGAVPEVCDEGSILHKHWLTYLPAGQLQDLLLHVQASQQVAMVILNKLRSLILFIFY